MDKIRAQLKQAYINVTNTICHR